MSPAHQRPARTSYTTRSRSTGTPASTLWRRANNKSSLADKAANQQYLPRARRANLGWVSVAVGRQRLSSSSQVSTIAGRGHCAQTVFDFPGQRSYP
ncbi:hypothetical protein VI817_000225 [Penicillium citrinum]|nr:hypothetical protein VI817_000225 [Penicillium citrinum]